MLLLIAVVLFSSFIGALFYRFLIASHFFEGVFGKSPGEGDIVLFIIFLITGIVGIVAFFIILVVIYLVIWFTFLIQAFFQWVTDPHGGSFGERVRSFFGE